MSTVPKLLAREFKQAEFMRQIFFVKVPVGTPIEGMKDPAFWANVASSLQPNTRIEVMPYDGAYFAEFIVRAAGPNWAHVELLRHHAFVSAETVVEKAKGVEVNWGGPQRRFRVQRLSDKATLKDGFDTKEQANEWLAANLQAVA